MLFELLSKQVCRGGDIVTQLQVRMKDERTASLRNFSTFGCPLGSFETGSH